MAETTIDQTLQLAVRHHQAGQLPHAERLYRRILARHPDHAEALHHLGMIAAQVGRNDAAVELIRRAISLEPNWPHAHVNLGDILRNQGQPEQAIAAYRRAIELQPDLPEAHLNLAATLQNTGQLDEAIAAYRHAITINPNVPGFHGNLGVALKDRGRLDEAVAACRMAIALKPDWPEACHNLAVILQAKGELDEAIVVYRQAIALSPGKATAYRSLGQALQAKGLRDDALAAYQEALRLNPADDLARFEVAALEQTAAVSTAPPEFVRSLFDEYATRFDDHLVKQLSYRTPGELFDAVRSVDARDHLDMMDLGCGTGLCGVLLRSHARRLVGVDLSPRMLEQAAARKIYDELIESEIVAAMRARPLQWDLLLAGDVLVYIGDLSDVFSAASAALRPGGLFAFSVEKYDGDKYFLHEFKRFAHSLKYIRDLAAARSLKEVTTRAVTLRQEAKQGVQGWLVVLRKSE